VSGRRARVFFTLVLCLDVAGLLTAVALGAPGLAGHLLGFTGLGGIYCMYRLGRLR
jgi:hypothetical protein